MNFIKELLFKYWGKVDILISALGFISLAFPKSLSWRYKVLIIISGFALAVFIKLIRQSYNYYQGLNRPLKVKGSSQGEGVYKGKTLIRIENNNNLRDNTLLTLSCKGSNANQTICILKIVKCIRDEDILAIQIIPDTTNFNIKKYLNEESRLNSLYTNPIINYVELNQLTEN